MNLHPCCPLRFDESPQPALHLEGRSQKQRAETRLPSKCRSRQQLELNVKCSRSPRISRRNENIATLRVLSLEPVKVDAHPMARGDPAYDCVVIVKGTNPIFAG